MNKLQYLERLEKNLKFLPEEEISDIINDFKEYFEVGIERGRSEEELSLSLGNPKMLARQIRLESYIKKAEETKSALNILRAVFTSIGLSFFNLIVMLPVFLIVISALAVLFACSVSLSAAGITGTVGSFFSPLFAQYLTFSVNVAVSIFAFIGIGSLGILFFTGNIYIAKLIFRLIVRYLRFNLMVIKGRREQDEI
jgi:uncharacterized membrane protein